MRFLYKSAVVFDDHQLFADSFSSLLDKTKKFQEIRVISEYDSLLQYLMEEVRTEVYLFLDYYLGDGMLGVEVINEVRRLRKSIHIIVVSSVSNPVTIKLIKSYCPDAIISKSSGFSTVLKCLESLSNKENYYCPYIREVLEQAANEEVVVFSTREIEVLKFFAEGLSVIETAEKLIISKHTVVSHRRNMMKKTNSKTIIELLSYVRNNGILLN